MEYLAKPLRRKLESTVIEARDMAEAAARSVLEHLGVGETNAPEHLTEKQRALRRRLRAHGRQFGDHRRPDGHQSIGHLVQETGYEHWHRMLFARFLAESHLLMHPDGVPLTLDECDELAQDEGAANGWELAGRYASRMLPQIFRTDSPVLELTLAPEHQRALERLLDGLDSETFLAQDSLGWVYQFWQAKKKEEVNRSEVKIGAEELPAVTQLFTEPYMVSFLLDNSLGAWWVANHPDKPRPVSLEYLRTLEDGTPAAGRFEAWPKHLGELKVMDPCCGSGHFLVAAFLMLVPMRMSLEGLSAGDAVDCILAENIHGLELDARCVEIAVFALALAAWRYIDSGGYRQLPELNIACSGLSINTKKIDWLELTHGSPDIENSLERLYDLFKDAPVLGSLINPSRVLKKDMFEEDWGEIEPLIAAALSAEEDDKKELGIVAQGIKKAAELLKSEFSLVLTNVPYLALRKQDKILADHCKKHYPLSQQNLAVVFLDRCIEFALPTGDVALVLPQDWMFLDIYKGFRRNFLKKRNINFAIKLGVKAFQTPMWDMNIMLVSVGKILRNNNTFLGLDASKYGDSESKSQFLLEAESHQHSQLDQLNNPDGRIVFETLGAAKPLADYADALMGVSTGDGVRFNRMFWEVPVQGSDWNFIQGTISATNYFDGKEEIIYWQQGTGEIFELAESVKHLNHSAQNWQRGRPSWGKKGVSVSQMGNLPVSIYGGDIYDCNCCAIVPYDEHDVPAIWAYTSSEEFNATVRQINQALKVPPKTLLKIPFDKERWEKEALAIHPNGLPAPYSDDPTQWIFHGHPTQNDKPLQVAVARLLGYRWPAETDMEMELSDEARDWVARCKDLAPFVDDDGIACIPTIRGEKPAAERLLDLLQAAYSDDWSAHKLNQLLADAKAKGKGLDWWLREKFFEQHCKQFQHRPFIWHIWDGLKDGFAALVNYHKLDHKTLQTLIYTYLGDWIGLQERAVGDGVDGAELRLTAAQDLKKRLELILEGEAPYDIFIRWKPLEQQPIGWNPDLNDGVRLNIRPFMTAEVLRHNKKPKLNIHWNKDRGKDVESAPWYRLGLEYGGKEGDRINDHHLKLEEKRKAARH
ncbi:MAG: BREX-1 system adenine-specific DNA-methyltransferase PglX [Candidatus Thiodiazotropha lotti]|nr:BREX-1 system adenine-specific DNA-methyltransferase PglX [Candidatus Thiodiazotropha lotti]